jgi:probable rRNA maturation factor
LSVKLSVHVDPQFAAKVNDEHLGEVAERVLRAEDVDRAATVGLLVTDDETISRLNLQYRGEDRETDVLAFAMDDDLDGFVTPPSLPAHLGEIVVSYPRARAQAMEYGHGVEEELDRLLIHGLLHLLGYDDSNDEQREKMWARQESLLRSVRADG